MTETVHAMGDVCKALDVTHRALRVWEEAGLLGKVGRDANRRRVFTDLQVEKATFVRVGQAVGMTLEELRECVHSRSPVELRKMQARVRQHVTLLQDLIPEAFPEYDL